MKFNLTDQYGIVQEFELKDGERKGDVIVHSHLKEDIGEIIENNKQQQKQGKQVMGKGTQTSQYKLGELSNLQAYMLMQQNIFWDDKALRRWFNDLDNYLWRTVEKKRRGGKNAVQDIQV